MYSYVPPERIVWISMGSLRFPPANKQEIKKRYPHTKIIYSEMVRGHDNKLRYIRPLRVKLYNQVYQALTDVKNPPFIYFCMENSIVWKDVMGYSPESNAHLDYMFAKSLYNRFNNIVPEKPKLKYYENVTNLDGKKFSK